MAELKAQEGVRAQDDFLMILPEIGRLLKWCFRYEEAEKREELVQDALCRAWQMYAAAHRRGKRLSAHGLSWYAWLGARSGRRFCGESKRSVNTWQSLTGVDLDELLVADLRERWPVVDQVAFRIDWFEFVSRCSSQEARAIGLLAFGHRRSKAAELLGVSPAWMTEHMARVHADWEELCAVLDFGLPRTYHLSPERQPVRHRISPPRCLLRKGTSHERKCLDVRGPVPPDTLRP